MSISLRAPLDLYADALHQHAAGEDVCAVVRFEDGSERLLDVPRWASVADAVDERVLSCVRGPVLDVGCGPGRHLGALARRGVFALGVDLSPEAIALARGRGARALLGSIFDSVPQEGLWNSALLLDGNIGIGGHPRRLLDRVEQLLAPGGAILVELDPPGGAAREIRARIETGSSASEWFAWAQVPADSIAEHLCGSGLGVERAWCDEGRWFALLLKA